jgi:predicted 3-demethylubiquinone-9 3-methyltransferase (glyoxalase superfamily)
MQKITPNLWFDGNAKEAAEFYTSAFDDSAINNTVYYPTEGLADFQKDMAGKELTVDFTLGGYDFTAINAGPEFTFNQSTSFMLNFDPSRDERASDYLDQLWAKLADGGEVVMQIGEYPFSKRYGWLKDRFGLSWQFILTNPAGEPRPFIIPTLLFGDGVQDCAAEAIAFYLSVFKDAQQGNSSSYTEPTGPAKAGALAFADFMIETQWFAAMDAGVEQDFTFTEAVSFVVLCKDQTEIDYYWQKLSSVPEAEQCGWCKDQFGVSWQIVPENMGELMSRPNAFEHMMQMKKLVINDF